MPHKSVKNDTDQWMKCLKGRTKKLKELGATCRLPGDDSRDARTREPGKEAEEEASEESQYPCDSTGRCSTTGVQVRLALAKHDVRCQLDRVLLGSGGIATEDRRATYRSLVAAHFKDCEKVLFIPYASSDHPGYTRDAGLPWPRGPRLVGIEAMGIPLSVESMEGVYVGGEFVPLIGISLRQGSSNQSARWF